MIRYGNGITVGASPACRIPHVYCTESGVMCSFADSQSAIFGLKPKWSPLQRISKTAFSEDDVFVVDEALKLDFDKSMGTADEGGESACSGFERKETKMKRNRKNHGLWLGDGIFCNLW